jgi:phosphate butyryltransferase
MLISFDQLNGKVKAAGKRKRMVVAAAADEHSLEAALYARKAGLVEVFPVGNKEEILRILEKSGETISEADIHDERDGAIACAKAVALVREGKGDFLMKGNIDTGTLLKAVVNKEAGLNQGKIMSHFTIFEIPGCPKLLTVVDGGMVTYPTLEQKKGIIENTVQTLLALGYEKPKVGVLACVEKMNPKMPETVEAAQLEEMNKRGEIANCVVNGPVSYDCAMNAEIANLKGYLGEVAGDVDVLVAPNIHAGNIMGKMLTVTCKAKMAGIIVGAGCPIVLTSRGSSAEEKFLSILLSAAVSGSNNQGE